MKQMDEGIISWCFFRVLENLSKEPPDVSAAQSYAVDGVNYIIKGSMPSRYDPNAGKQQIRIKP